MASHIDRQSGQRVHTKSLTQREVVTVMLGFKDLGYVTDFRSYDSAGVHIELYNGQRLELDLREARAFIVAVRTASEWPKTAGAQLTTGNLAL